jgi:hypothetical protein
MRQGDPIVTKMEIAQSEQAIGFLTINAFQEPEKLQQ